MHNDRVRPLTLHPHPCLSKSIALTHTHIAGIPSLSLPATMAGTSVFIPGEKGGREKTRVQALHVFPASNITWHGWCGKEMACMCVP